MDDTCFTCGFWDSDYYSCICPSTDKWYACPIESEKEENQKALADLMLVTFLEQAIKENNDKIKNYNKGVKK